MKNRILPILLSALLLSSALVGCTSTKSKGDDTKSEQTKQTEEPQTEAPGVTSEWVEADETVFVTSDKLIIRVAANNTAETAAKLDLMTKLKRTGVSNDGKWSRVEYNGSTYYTFSTGLTNADLAGERFTDCGKVVMYTTKNCNVRLYASSDDKLSKIVTELDGGTAVTVIATGTVNLAGWSKIAYVDGQGAEHNYFISSALLSAEKKEPPVEIDYSQFFTPCSETTYYATANLNVRSAPDPETGLYKGGFKLDDAVTVIGVGTGDYADWVAIKYKDKVAIGDTQTYSTYYVNSSYLSTKKSTDQVLLSEVLAQYPTFTEITPTTMYITKNTVTINVRSKPDADDSKAIVALETPLTAKSAITVVAKGKANGVNWVIFESGNTYLFVSAAYVTTDPNGEPNPKSIEEIIKEYGFVALASEKTVWATEFTNLRSAPSNTVGVSKTLNKNDTATAIATGNASGTTWYLLKVENAYYFAGIDRFTDVNPKPAQ